MGDLNWPGAIQDIAACAKYLRETMGVKKGKHNTVYYKARLC